MQRRRTILVLLVGLSGCLGANETTDAEQDADLRRRNRCGDNICQRSESCSSCASDCGPCAGGDLAITPPPPNDLAPTPGGGLAARYAGDVGIGSDPAVLFADDFESYNSSSDSSARYNMKFGDVQPSTAEKYSGNKSVVFTRAPGVQETSNALGKWLPREVDQLYMRYYSKFDGAFNIVGSSHNGSSISAHYFTSSGQATPGQRADGYNKFLVGLENWRGVTSDPNPGYLNMYVYWPEMRENYGDHFLPTGEILPWTYIPGNWGPTFVPRPHFVPELNRWYCYELMVKANRPGQRDGRLTAWVDGQIVMDFPNVRLRDTNTLKIDLISFSLHSAETPNTTRKYWDNLVVATSYIGPMVR